MTTPSEIELVKQDIDKLRKRIEDVAMAGNHTRAEVDSTTEMVRDHHRWIVHGPLARNSDLHPKKPHES